MMSGTKAVWEKYTYDSKEMGSKDNYLDCSFVCKNIEKENGCDLFALEGQICYVGKANHITGAIETEVSDATIYITDGKFESTWKN